MATLVRTLLALLTTVLLSGCASMIKPNLGPDPEIARAYDVAPTLTNAIAVGTSMRERYTAKVEEQIAWERGIGMGLIGAAAIAADLAMRGVGQSEILGLGLTSAAVYTGSNWLFNKPQQTIYALGASAVQCALDVIQPLQEPYGSRDELKTKIGETVATVDEINRLLGARDPTTTSEARARSMVDRANTQLPVARDALGVLDSSPGRLRSSLNAIQVQITSAYVANSPNMQVLLESLGKALPMMGSRIVGMPLPVSASDAKSLRSSSAPELERKTGELDQLLTRLSQIVASANVNYSEDKLRLCNVDPKQVGLSMKLTPIGDLSVELGSAGTVVASGGALPYRATWIGPRPPGDWVTLTVESGQGFITVEAKAGAKEGAYQLLIADNGQGREVVNVVIKNSGTIQPAKVAVRAGASTLPSIDATVQRVQQALIGRGFDTVTVNGKNATLIADGRMGEITTEAMRRFLKNQGAADNQIPDGDQLFKEVAQLLGIK